MGKFSFVARGLVVLVVAACTDRCVGIPNQPNRGRVFTNAGRPGAVVSNIYTNVHQGTLGGAAVLDGGANDGAPTAAPGRGNGERLRPANFAMGPRR